MAESYRTKFELGAGAMGWRAASRKRKTGGQRGIRTLETVARLHAFQACAFDHSAICPAGEQLKACNS